MTATTKLDNEWQDRSTYYQKNDALTIYEDPITQKREEGRAFVVRAMYVQPGIYEAQLHNVGPVRRGCLVRYLVKFRDDEDGFYEREVFQPVD